MNSLTGQESPSHVARMRRELAGLALRRGDPHAAASQLEEVRRLVPQTPELLSELRTALEAAVRWQEAVDLREQELAMVTDVREQVAHLRALADICRERLQESERGFQYIERAVELVPDDVPLMRSFLDACRARAEWRKFLVIGERLMAQVAENQLDAAFYADLARSYEEAVDDPQRAREFYAKALARAPNDQALRAKVASAAKASGDYAAYAAAEEAEIDSLADTDDKVKRLQSLAEVYLRQLNTPQKAAVTLFKARQLRPKDPELLRRLADTYALDARFYAQAADVYRSLLAATPLDADILRILARLSGQLGDNDRAYGYYAALLTLVPADAEARRFVAACRSALPAGPQRALTDADRALVLHPDQGGVIEELFAPLARFAELTQRDDLTRRGITERDLLAPTDKRLQWLRAVLEPMGVAQAAVYVWRGGGFACHVELVGTPAILLGSQVADDTNDRLRAFLAARSAELFRTGHTLCERLNSPDLVNVLGALCMAVVPGTAVPGVGPEAKSWSTTIGAPMTDAIRASMAPRVQRFLQQAPAADVSRWCSACLATAARMAMVFCCDVEDAVNAMIRLQGIDDVPDDQRKALLAESPEALDLLRYSLSEPYFKLRASLGLALRRSK